MFMYACMDSILCGPHVIRTYKIGPAPVLSCAPLIYGYCKLDFLTLFFIPMFCVQVLNYCIKTFNFFNSSPKSLKSF